MEFAVNETKHTHYLLKLIIQRERETFGRVFTLLNV